MYFLNSTSKPGRPFVAATRCMSTPRRLTPTHCATLQNTIWQKDRLRGSNPTTARSQVKRTNHSATHTARVAYSTHYVYRLRENSRTLKHFLRGWTAFSRKAAGAIVFALKNCSRYDMIYNCCSRIFCENSEKQHFPVIFAKTSNP